MSTMALQTLVGIALVDHRFCEELLNGKRDTLLTEFDLTDEEQEAVLAIETDSVQEFTAKLYEWLTA